MKSVRIQVIDCRNTHTNIWQATYVQIWQVLLGVHEQIRFIRLMRHLTVSGKSKQPSLINCKPDYLGNMHMWLLEGAGYNLAGDFVKYFHTVYKKAVLKEVEYG